MQDVPDEIIRQAAKGDIGAFEKIYKALSRFVYNIALRITNNSYDAEEITQDVFLKAYNKLKHFKFCSTNLRKIAAFLCIIMLFFSAVPAYVWPFEKKEGHQGYCGKTDFAVELNLTAEQQERLEEVKKANKETHKNLSETLEKERLALRKELEKKTSDPAEIKKILARINKVQAGMMDLKVEKLLKIKEILTPEQFVKFNNLTERRHKKMHRKGMRFKK